MAALPSVAELLASVKDLTRADGSLQRAWSNSFPDGYHCCEQGGFIYVGPCLSVAICISLFLTSSSPDYPVPARITRAYIVEVKPGKFMNQRTMGTNASIDLNSPGIKNDNVILGENIYSPTSVSLRALILISTTVANFHTHPLSGEVQGNPQPSQADIANSYARGLPGIVLSRDGIYSYGPDTRVGVNNPKGYPGAVAAPPGIPPVRLERHSPPPTTVKNQWPEGTGNGFVLQHIANPSETEHCERGAGDVLYAEWSRKGVEYGRHLVDGENLLR